MALEKGASEAHNTNSTLDPPPPAFRFLPSGLHPLIPLPPQSSSQRRTILLLVVGGIAIAVIPLPVTITGIVGLSYGLMLLARPELGVWVLPLAIPFGSMREVPFAGYSVGATELIIVTTSAAWLARSVAQRRVYIRLPPLTVPLLLLIGTMLLSTRSMYAVGPTVKELVKWGEILVVYVLVANLITGPRARQVLISAILLAVTLSALHGIAGSLLRMGPPQFAILGGRLYRAAGTFRQPNPFGGYMNHGLPMAISLLVACMIQQMKIPSRSNFPASVSLSTLVLVGVSGILAIGLALSWSRGAWLGAVAGLATVAAAWSVLMLGGGSVCNAPPQPRRPAVILIWPLAASVVIFIMLGGLSLLPTSITARLDSALGTFTTLNARGARITHANFATLERVAHWQAAWDMWRDHFWTGIGIGNYAAAYPDYRLPKWPYALGHAHNIYFNMGAEIGFLGLTAYLTFLGSALWYCWHVAQSSRDVMNRGLAIGVLGILVALAIHNSFDNMYVHDMGIHLVLALGAVSSAERS